MLQTGFRPLLTSLIWRNSSLSLCSRCMATIATNSKSIHVPLVLQAVRTRFAPSPTGQLHLGSLRTALFNFLLARHYNGQFILRIEDTDRNRTVDGAVDEMCRLLKWAGIDWDEGPGIGGVQGPYRQSERLKIYRGLSDCLIDSKRAYRCFCSQERLDSVRTEAQRYRRHGSYDRQCYSIAPEESEERARKGELYVVRLISPTTWPTVNDYLHGEVHFPTPSESLPKRLFDDAILLKSDGWPTYHLACVVDDHLMEISHVIRGEEWLPSTPKHLVLYDAFGWKPPVFVHLPLLHSMSGRKLSKRDVNGDRSFLVKEYEADGILPEALVNYVALFGWSNKTESDSRIGQFVTVADPWFTLDGLTTGSLKVSPDKLPFLNHRHILRKLSTSEETKSLVESALPFLKEHLSPSEMPSQDYLTAVVRVSQERMHTLKDVYQAGPYFFTEPDFSLIDMTKFRKSHPPEVVDKVLLKAKDKISRVQEWNSKLIADAIKEIGKDLSLPSRVVMQILRYAIAGLESGVGVPVIIEILGRERVNLRLDTCRSYQCKDEH